MENREVEGLSGIASYIEEMEFKKKTLGGCDEEDVMEKIGIICDKYQEVIHRLCERQGRMEERAQNMHDE